MYRFVRKPAVDPQGGSLPVLNSGKKPWFATEGEKWPKQGCCVTYRRHFNRPWGMEWEEVKEDHFSILV